MGKLHPGSSPSRQQAASDRKCRRFNRSSSSLWKTPGCVYSIQYSDTKTHLELYRAFPQLGGIVHTHSTHAVAFAQARRDLPAFGTTHADYFYGPVPCTRELTPEEIDEDYEKNTGKVIVETFKARGIDPLYVPGVLCASHGPFTWGKDAAQAVYHAVVLEEVARMAILTLTIDPGALPAPQHVLDKHFMRKHGPNAYYGQK